MHRLILFCGMLGLALTLQGCDALILTAGMATDSWGSGDLTREEAAKTPEEYAAEEARRAERHRQDMEESKARFPRMLIGATQNLDKSAAILAAQSTPEDKANAARQLQDNKERLAKMKTLMAKAKVETNYDRFETLWSQIRDCDYLLDKNTYDAPTLAQKRREEIAYEVKRLDYIKLNAPLALEGVRAAAAQALKTAESARATYWKAKGQPEEKKLSDIFEEKQRAFLIAESAHTAAEDDAALVAKATQYSGEADRAMMRLRQNEQRAQDAIGQKRACATYAERDEKTGKVSTRCDTGYFGY